MALSLTMQLITNALLSSTVVCTRRLSKNVKARFDYALCTFVTTTCSASRRNALRIPRVIPSVSTTFDRLSPSCRIARATVSFARFET
jgi:hypothetical protein